jgi:hypothetical protein
VLTRPAVLQRLLERLDGVDRLVLLGDTLELRHGPTRDALAVAEPVIRAIGDALAPSAPAEVEVVYPGLWLRDDVYAMHGHYLDVHVTVPTIERLAIGVVGRMSGALPDPATPDDYEALLAPVYALSQASAQRTVDGRVALGGRTGMGIWSAMAGRGRRRIVRAYALQVPLRLGVMAANRAGIGPVGADIGILELRRSALLAIGEVTRRLRLAPAHLIFGHTHRTGMLDGDDGAEWRTPSGIVLHNSGSWVHERLFTGRGDRPRHPYWPGGAIVLDDDGPPRLERLLDGVGERDLAPLLSPPDRP